jgi:pimeloyl-ACP methyl ester carboxylesterase
MTPQSHIVDIGLKFHLREWPGDATTFVLLHGLSSNSRTWDMVATQLARSGHRVIAVDQRGHGLSDKAEDGYDFATITADLARLLQVMELEGPILVGQSWGGNVVLEFGARYPGLASGLGFIDGGFLDLQSRPGATWETISLDLKPPNLLGTPRETMKRKLKEGHPDWSDTGIEATLANFETLPDGTVRPWLTLDRHMAILRAMWEQRPTDLYPKIAEPVLVCVAQDDTNPEWMAVKSKQVGSLQAGSRQCTVRWFEHTDHDIHVHRPDELATLLLETAENGIWRER